MMKQGMNGLTLPSHCQHCSPAASASKSFVSVGTWVQPDWYLFSDDDTSIEFLWRTVISDQWTKCCPSSPACTIWPRVTMPSNFSSSFFLSLFLRSKSTHAKWSTIEHWGSHLRAKQRHRQVGALFYSQLSCIQQHTLSNHWPPRTLERNWSIKRVEEQAEI